MFGKRRTPDLGDRAGTTEESMEAEGVAIPPTRPAARPAPKRPARVATPEAARPAAAAPQEPIRRPADPIPSPGRRIEPMAPPEPSTNEGRKLVVGQDISLSGEIKSCQKLVVEGQVESSNTECSALQISATGLYKGSASVDHADISGRFEGDLTVHGQLTMRATGRLVGSLRYAQMEIERGGRISGTMEEIEPSAAMVAETSGASAIQAEVESRLAEGPLDDDESEGAVESA
ncbi:MAG: polymer-forming cytoskeletal protein [Pseudomonadota bacterium]